MLPSALAIKAQAHSSRTSLPSFGSTPAKYFANARRENCGALDVIGLLLARCCVRYAAKSRTRWVNRCRATGPKNLPLSAFVQ